MLLLLYLLVCSFSFGLIDLTPLLQLPTPLGRVNGEDALLLVLLLSSIPSYLRQRRGAVSPWFRRVELGWVVFIIWLAIESLRSPADSLTERFVNLRFVEDYLLFFPSVAVLTSWERVRKFSVVGIVFALAGTALTVAQSVYGLSYLFDSPFYAIGDWGGNRMMVGALARVNLPISDWVAFVLLVLVAASLIRFRSWHLVLAGVLSLTILVNFARSLWMGMSAALIVMVVLLLWTGRLDGKGLVRLGLVPVAVLLGIFIAPFFGLDGISSALMERLNEGLYYITSDAGTWGDRLDVAGAAMDLWWTDPLWGIGTAYYKAFGTWIDLAYPATLVSIGAVGLVLEMGLLLVCSLAGISTMRQGLERDSVPLVLAGISVPAEVVLILVYQQWMNPRTWAILALASALTIVGPGLVGMGRFREEVASSDMLRAGARYVD